MYYEKIAASVIACVLAAAVSNAQRRNWSAEAREPVQHTFTGAATLDLDNINGKNEIIGDDGDTIRVEGERVVRAIDQQALDRAAREVTLDINQQNGVAQLYVNGPFRGNRGSDYHGFHERSDRDYEVTYNLTIHAPRRTTLDLRSVNGPIQVSGTEGAFRANAVNGSVSMASVAGGGNATTVNGTVTVSFRSSPVNPVQLKTVNGRIDATFPPGLNADLRLQTLNGPMYTDFDMTALSPSSVRRRLNRIANLRAGAGGPELSFETVNGAITIRKGPVE